MVRILFHADPHGKFSPLREAIVEHQPDAIVLLGDQTLTRPLSEELAGIDLPPLKWIFGNHDMDSETMYDNLFQDRQGALHGRVEEVAGVRIAGLGGVFKGKVWRPDSLPVFRRERDFLNTLDRRKWWRGGLPLKMRYAIFPEDYDRLSLQRADILVTHEGPESHQHGFRALGDLARQMRVQIMLHGHHHVDYEALIHGGIKVYGLGLAGSRLIEFPLE